MGARRSGTALVLLLLALLQGRRCGAEILTPPYFNLAEGKEIIATATCGVDTPGPELYCQLVGANSDQELNINQNIIQGQVCFLLFFHFISIIRRHMRERLCAGARLCVRETVSTYYKARTEPRLNLWCSIKSRSNSPLFVVVPMWGV